jgi:hypothetical protein
MKTLVKNGISLYVFDDSEVLKIGNKKTVVGEPVKLIIMDCGSNNSNMHTDVTPPADWQGGKYLFDGTTWTLNPDWSENL